MKIAAATRGSMSRLRNPKCCAPVYILCTLFQRNIQEGSIGITTGCISFSMAVHHFPESLFSGQQAHNCSLMKWLNYSDASLSSVFFNLLLLLPATTGRHFALQTFRLQPGSCFFQTCSSGRRAIEGREDVTQITVAKRSEVYQDEDLISREVNMNCGLFY